MDMIKRTELSRKKETLTNLEHNTLDQYKNTEEIYSCVGGKFVVSSFEE